MSIKIGSAIFFFFLQNKIKSNKIAPLEQLVSCEDGEKHRLPTSQQRSNRLVGKSCVSARNHWSNRWQGAQVLVTDRTAKAVLKHPNQRGCQNNANQCNSDQMSQISMLVCAFPESVIEIKPIICLGAGRTLLLLLDQPLGLALQQTRCGPSTFLFFFIFLSRTGRAASGFNDNSPDYSSDNPPAFPADCRELRLCSRLPLLAWWRFILIWKDHQLDKERIAHACTCADLCGRQIEHSHNCADIYSLSLSLLSVSLSHIHTLSHLHTHTTTTTVRCFGCSMWWPFSPSESLFYLRWQLGLKTRSQTVITSSLS